ncbi:amidase family protein [Rhodococcus sp. WAY2]|uniref:amidase family protein n=1 Tax=Rhodococcus sp. WAY2 TaxID=2663121 RepID=UPI0013203ACE|nr:amidase family protein [Rhodococcus sp. WAY2]QHE72410.1 Aspartyl-tRNA(Asn) amidotransferase subunit A / Glutamyl-tRNA(Gln) amidotransferase subunit A [Rhodococcus sp. WAY2]
MSDITFAPAREQARAVASGEVSSVELVDLHLERIAAHNRRLNAIVTLDPDRARAEAAAADSKRAAGEELGLLHGLPITLKDSFETQGMRTVCGRRDLEGYVPKQDAEAVTRLRAAGAVIMGAFSYDRSGLTPASNAALLGRLLQHPRGDAGHALKGTFQSHYSWMQADTARHAIRLRWIEFFKDFDVVLMPVAPTVAPPHHNRLVDKFGRSIDVDGEQRPYWDQVKWSALANISGGPATTIPVRRGRTGLPVGLQVLGPAGGDLTTIEFAALLGREVEGYVPPPAYS